MCIPVLIKAISSLVLALVALGFLLFRFFKKINKCKLELILGILLCLALLGFSGKEFYNAFNPDMKNITVEFVSYHREIYRLGFEYHFLDGKDDYFLYMDPLTSRKYIGNNDLEIGKKYIVSYETNEEMIVSLKEVDEN
ncbi:MAG: hypothetical protein IKW45_00405 [Clostridia bacterium]|nr:hypothetical protein [Clostridia bacterium]